MVGDKVNVFYQVATMSIPPIASPITIEKISEWNLRHESNCIDRRSGCRHLCRRKNRLGLNRNGNTILAFVYCNACHHPRPGSGCSADPNFHWRLDDARSSPHFLRTAGRRSSRLLYHRVHSAHAQHCGRHRDRLYQLCAIPYRGW